MSKDLSTLSAAKQALLQKRLKGKTVVLEKQQIPRRTKQGAVPLSFAQQRLWFLDQLEGGDSSTYHVPIVWKLHGMLHLEAMAGSINEIVRRHEALRTTFAWQDGQPVQIVHPHESVEFPVIDLQELTGETQQEAVQTLIREAITEPFDLAASPPSRLVLLKLREQEHILIWNMHHIVSDGWSMGVITKELAALYAAFSCGQPSPLPELPIQYPDVALWQREQLQGAVLEKQLAYWKKQLGGTLPVLQLPTDKPRPSQQTSRGATQIFRLPLTLVEQLRQFSQREEATLFMTLLAAWKALLYRYSGQEDLIVGSPIANRNRSEMEGLIGFFVNTLVLRTDVSGNPTFRELVSRVRQVSFDAFGHQDVPFEKLVEELQPERDLSQSPLFRVLFVLVNASMEPLQLPNLTMTLMEVEHDTAKFDLSLFFAEEGAGLVGWVEYNTDLFEQETVSRLIQHLQHVLAGAMANPAQHLSELPVLDVAEKRLLLHEWNDTRTKETDERCVHELVAEQARCTPDEVAVLFDAESLTYRELDDRANRLAQKLRHMGVGPDVLVGICLKRSLDMPVSVLGVLKAGGAYVPLDPDYPHERIATIMVDANVKVLLTQTDLVETLPEHQAAVLCLDRSWEVPSSEVGKSSVTPENLAYVLYTSGSTGKPKGVAMPHRPLVNLIKWQCRQAGLVEEETVGTSVGVLADESKDASAAVSVGKRTLQFTSLNFDVSFQEIFSTWCSGGTLVLVSEDMRRDSAELLRYLYEQAVEQLFLPFVALQHLAEVAEDADNLPPLREVITAGEQLQVTPSIIRFFERLPGCTLHNQYGPSESHVVTEYTLSGSSTQWPSLPPIGRAVDNVQLYVLDAHMQPVPLGVPGELYIGGVALSRGYLNRQELTEERFIPNPFAEQVGERLYKTGDLVRYLPDGNLVYLGRMDQQVKLRGYRIELGEIETVLGQHPELRETVVMVREDVPGDKRLVAYVVPQQGSDMDASRTSELRHYLKAQLPEYMIPTAFILLDELPLTPNGKVDRRALPAPHGQDRMETYVAPRNRFEFAMVKLWEDVLKRSPIGVLDNFFAVGGESLKAVSLMSAIRKRFDVHVPLAKLFQTATVAELCQHISEMENGLLTSKESDCLILIQQGDGSTPPLFLVHPGWGGVLCYAPLAEVLGERETVYGIQAVGYDSDEPALSSVQEMADRYLAEVLRVSPAGPYRLGGWSMGGTIALEMARRLEQRGETVEFLGMIDAPFLGALRHEELGFDVDDPKTIIKQYANLKKVGLDESIFEALPSDEALVYLLKHAKAANVVPPGATVEYMEREVKIFLAHELAIRDYEPGEKVQADIHLFHSVEEDLNNPVPLVGETDWDEQTTGLVSRIPVHGNHHNIVYPPHVSVLGEKMRDVLSGIRAI